MSNLEDKYLKPRKKFLDKINDMWPRDEKMGIGSKVRWEAEKIFEFIDSKIMDLDLANGMGPLAFFGRSQSQSYFLTCLIGESIYALEANKNEDCVLYSGRVFLRSIPLSEVTSVTWELEGPTIRTFERVVRTLTVNLGNQDALKMQHLHGSPEADTIWEMYKRLA